MSRDSAYLLDMLVAAREVVALTEGMTLDGFSGDRTTHLAAMRLMQNLGEAARAVSSETRLAHPEVPWRDLIAWRNRLVHEYFRVSLPALWRAVRREAPPLVELLVGLVPTDDGL